MERNRRSQALLQVEPSQHSLIAGEIEIGGVTDLGFQLALLRGAAKADQRCEGEALGAVAGDHGAQHLICGQHRIEIAFRAQKAGIGFVRGQDDIARFGEMLVALSTRRPAGLFAKPFGEQAGFKFWKPIVWDKVQIGMGYHYRCRYEFVLFFEKGKRRLN
ncbi:hypothetical protein, partial [uncultured Bradyrhizobium sp.]|uniref:hypothetical protein n=1 Tax=uncultured Bradyrhizobium sp. TaxID=199684 RepID=UPI003457A1BF